MGIESKCHLCGYEWEYNGSKDEGTLICCPRPECRKLTPVGMGKRGADPDTSTMVSCHRCDYKWMYRGKKDAGERINCPDCGTSTEI